MELDSTFTEVKTTLVDIMQYKLFEIKQTPVTLSSLLMFLIVVLAFFFISRFLNRVLLRRILERFHLERGLEFTLIRIGHYVTMIIGAIVAFQFVGIDLSGLAVIFGLLSVGIGFGLQNITANFVSGLILLFERPIKVGDRVIVGDAEGDVLEINMRATTIQSLTNISIIVPNQEFISGRVVNWSHGDPKIRIDIAVGVSYGSDLETVIRALREVAEEHPRVLKTPEPDVLLTEFGDSSWNMKLRVWVAQPKRHHITRSEINCAIVHKFREYGIEIPFPQTDLHIRSPLPVPLSRAEASS